MNDANQLPLPASFIALFIPAGRSRPAAARDEIAARYDFCEDLASALTERARNLRWNLGVTEADVLQRMHAGLAGPGSDLSAAEAGWVLCRLAELLDWPMPACISGASEPPCA